MGRRNRRSRRSKGTLRRWLPTIVGLLLALVVLLTRGSDKGTSVGSTDTNHVTRAQVVRYKPWAYVNPLRLVRHLQRGRVDMGADYEGSGPILALGDAKVIMASDHDSGPLSCWGRTCWPGGGIVVYRLMDGPFAGKCVYDAEKITATVRAGQTVKAGQRIATLHHASPGLETGWASGKGAETLAVAERHQDPSGDPGGWSTIEGRNFNHVLTRLGAPSAILEPDPPHQRMPAGWPRLGSSSGTTRIPRSSSPLSEGSTVPR